jgi:hypothetical protein
MELDLAYIIVIVLLSIALIALIVHMLGTSTIERSHKRHWYPWNKNRNRGQQIGGCAGTKYGCCPNSQIPKLNYLGTNC